MNDNLPTWLTGTELGWHRDGGASFIAMYCKCGKWHYHKRGGESSSAGFAGYGVAKMNHTGQHDDCDPCNIIRRVERSIIETQTTPRARPWYTSHNTYNDKTYISNNEHHIAEMRGGCEPTNAALIVRAVNRDHHFDPLMEALETMLTATQWLRHAEALDKAEATARAVLDVVKEARWIS